MTELGCIKNEYQDLSAFREKLEKHIWSFDPSINNYSALTKSCKKENDLYLFAYRNGPNFIREFHYVKQSKLNSFTDEKIKINNEAKDKKYNTDILTGNEEFDDYRKKLRNHDWYWSFSDDGNVARNGSEREEKLYGIAKEKGGIFLDQWNYAVKNYRVIK